MDREDRIVMAVEVIALCLAQYHTGHDYKGLITDASYEIADRLGDEIDVHLTQEEVGEENDA